MQDSFTHLPSHVDTVDLPGATFEPGPGITPARHIPEVMLEHVQLPLENPVVVFAVVMLIVLVAPLVFTRLRIPGLVGLIIAGVVVGPHALGILERDETMELLGTVGLLYIMFVAGLEIDLHQFMRYRRRSLLFSVFTYGLPQALGLTMALVVLGFGWPPAILLGSILASHTLVAYPIVSRMGLAKNEAVTTAVGATIITDSLALLVLAVIAGAAEGELNAAFWTRLVVSLAIYVGVVLVAVPWIGRWFFRNVEESSGAMGFVFVLATVFTASFLAEVAGVEAIVGAFLAGLALNRLVPEQGTLMNRVQFVGESLFIPFFLLSVGMLVDVVAFVTDPGAWLVATVMIGSVIAAKWGAAFLTRWLFGYSTDEAWTIFGLTLAQAAATLAAVLIGFELNLFGEAVLNATILMILVTCLLSPWVAERYGRRVALAEEERPYEPSEAPQRILIPVIEEDWTDALVELALMIREPRSEQPLFPLTVVPERAGVEAHVVAGEKLLRRTAAHGVAANVPMLPLTRVDCDVAAGIQRAITEERITTVVLGWNGQNVARRHTFGRVLDHLVEQTREMVLVSKLERPVNTIARVVVTFPPFIDREPGFPHALRTVKVLAGQLGARLVVACTDDARPVLEAKLRQTRPEVPLSFLSVASWTDLVGALQGHVTPRDLLVVTAVRQGALSWRPAANRLPRVLTQRFAGVSQIYLYLSEVPFSTPAVIARPEVSLPEAPVVTMPVSGDSWEAVLSRMVASTIGSDPQRVSAVVRGLLDLSSGYAPEKRPGAVLFHTWVPDLPAPALHVGVAPRELRLPRVAHGVCVVAVLLSPEDPTSESYLARLSQVAELLRPEETIQRLKRASSADEVRAALMRRG